MSPDTPALGRSRVFFRAVRIRAEARRVGFRIAEVDVRRGGDREVGDPHGIGKVGGLARVGRRRQVEIEREGSVLDGARNRLQGGGGDDQLEAYRLQPSL